MLLNYERQSELFDSFDLIIADDVVESEEKRFDRVLLHFDGLQPKIWLLAMIVPALHLLPDVLTLQQQSMIMKNELTEESSSEMLPRAALPDREH